MAKGRQRAEPWRELMPPSSQRDGIAAKQHAELVNTLDLIEVLPPGLYEIILEEKKTEDPAIASRDERRFGA